MMCRWTIQPRCMAIVQAVSCVLFTQLIKHPRLMEGEVDAGGDECYPRHLGQFRRVGMQRGAYKPQGLPFRRKDRLEGCRNSSKHVESHIQTWRFPSMQGNANAPRQVVRSGGWCSGVQMALEWNRPMCAILSFTRRFMYDSNAIPVNCLWAHARYLYTLIPPPLVSDAISTTC